VEEHPYLPPGTATREGAHQLSHAIKNEADGSWPDFLAAPSLVPGRTERPKTPSRLSQLSFLPSSSFHFFTSIFLSTLHLATLVLTASFLSFFLLTVCLKLSLSHFSCCATVTAFRVATEAVACHACASSRATGC
jgi:hypothetical protein